MDPSLRSSNALLDRTSADLVQLLTRFESIVKLADLKGKDRNTVASEAFQMEVETAALVRAAEDLLSLSRSLKEAWLFGQLNSVSSEGEHTKTDEDAKAVGAALQKLLKSESGKL